MDIMENMDLAINGTIEEIKERMIEEGYTHDEIESKLEEAISWYKKHESVMLSVSEQKNTIKQWYKLYQNGRIKFNNDYQRKNVWDNGREQGLLNSWYSGLPTPNIIIVKKEDKSGWHYEVIDGQQRIMTGVKWFENKLRVPSSVPSVLGGGKLRKDVSQPLIELIESATISATLIDGASEQQIREIYLRVQKGMPLKLGEEVQGEYGSARELIDKLEQHPFVQRITSRIRCASYAFAAYLFVIALDEYNSNRPSIINLSKEKVLATIEKNRTMTKQMLKEVEYTCFRIVNLLELMCHEHDLEKVELTHAVMLCYVVLFLELQYEVTSEKLFITYDKVIPMVRYVSNKISDPHSLFTEEELPYLEATYGRRGVSDKNFMFRLVRIFMDKYLFNLNVENYSDETLSLISI